MTPYDLFLMAAALSALCLVYLAYWTGWCWAWHFVWRTGPQWLVRPNVFLFLAVHITGVIITLMILSKASDT